MSYGKKLTNLGIVHKCVLQEGQSLLLVYSDIPGESRLVRLEGNGANLIEAPIRAKAIIIESDEDLTGIVLATSQEPNKLTFSSILDKDFILNLSKLEQGGN